MSAIRTEGLTRIFKRERSELVTALDDVNIAVDEGEIFGDVLFPSESLPGWVSWVAQALPLKDWMAMMRFAIFGIGNLDLTTSLFNQIRRRPHKEKGIYRYNNRALAGFALEIF